MVAEWAEDRQAAGEVTAPRTSWPAATTTCGYVARMVDAWATDAPTGGRHHWAFGQQVRLACARRLGCITDTDHARALDRLQHRLDELRAHDGPRPGEVRMDAPYAIDTAERKTETQARAELGDHHHEHDPDTFFNSILGPGGTLAGQTGTTTDATGGVPLDLYAVALEREVLKLRLRDDARTTYEAQKALANPAPPFDDGLLADVLARPTEPPERISGLIPSEASVLLVAKRKTGKTTFMLNLARSLITGEQFLGRFDVRPLTGRVGFLNFEVSGRQLARWADEAGVDRQRFYLVNLRGRRNPLVNPVDRAELAARLRAHDVETLVVDPFGRAYTGKSQNDSGEVGAWLVDLDAFARSEAGCTDLVLAAHAGWEGERTRGASALEDWADVIITLTNGKDEGDDGRYMAALGRDVDVDEDRLDFDPTTRTLTLTGAGSRRERAKNERSKQLEESILVLVNEAPGMTGTMVEDGLRRRGLSFRKGDERKALARLGERGLIAVRPGEYGRKHHYPAGRLPSVPEAPPGDAGEPPRLPLYGETGGARGKKGNSLPGTANPSTGEILEPTCTVRGQPMNRPSSNARYAAGHTCRSRHRPGSSPRRRSPHERDDEQTRTSRRLAARTRGRARP